MKALVAALKKSMQSSVNELKTFNWNDLNDPSSIGAWPGAVKLLLSLILFAVLVGAGFYFLIMARQEELARVAGDETGLRADLESKAALAANLQPYIQQMKDMEEKFGDLLRQLPAQTEVPGLIEDITYTGVGSGLEIKSITLDKDVAREFYVELPIRIEVKGSYHDFGTFVSGVSSLSRIVTLHDFTITQGDTRGELNMKILARTYRYKTGEASK
jgi:type IV pilus assembly protein PilO